MDIYGWVTPQKDLRPAGVAVTDIVTSLWLPPLSNAPYTLCSPLVQCALQYKYQYSGLV